jgi:hypothetical protein
MKYLLCVIYLYHINITAETECYFLFVTELMENSQNLNQEFFFFFFLWAGSTPTNLLQPT